MFYTVFFRPLTKTCVKFVIRVPVAGIETYSPTTGEWFCLSRNNENYFVSTGLGRMSFPMQVRLTSLFNEQLEYTILQLKNDDNIVSDVQFSDTEIRGILYCRHTFCIVFSNVE